MKPVRELMKDPRVAMGLAALALLFVVYRVMHMKKGPPPPPPAAAGSLPAPSPKGGADVPAPAGTGAFAPPPADNAASAAPRGDVVWNWERNPFSGPKKKAGHGTGEEFPTIIVPGFGQKKAAPPATPPTPAIQPPAPKGGPAAEQLPVLRGTVVSGGRGVAIFDRKLVPEGEKVAGWTVENVSAYDVSLTRAGERRTIELFKPGSVEGKGGKP